MEADQPISRDKVIIEFDRRARLHGNLNAVLDAGNKPGVSRQNILRDYLTRRSLFALLKPGHDNVILDFGCGMGRLTGFIKPKVSKIAGVDVSEAMIELARQQDEGMPKTEFCLINNNVIPFSDCIFNKVFTVWVLQHIADDELSLIAKEIHRVLIPGGILVFLEQTREKGTVLSDIHIHRSVNEYQTIFTNAGFTLKHSKPAMRVPSYAMAVWNKYKWLSKYFLPLLYRLEQFTLKYKTVNVDYYTWSFIFEKKK